MDDKDADSAKAKFAFALGERMKFLIESVGDPELFHGHLWELNKLFADARSAGTTDCVLVTPLRLEMLRRKLDRIVRENEARFREQKLRRALCEAYTVRGVEDTFLDAILGPDREAG